jgi:hypothetical protein
MDKPLLGKRDTQKEKYKVGGRKKMSVKNREKKETNQSMIEQVV